MADLYHLSWEELHRDTRALAATLADHRWQRIVGIARGGLVPAAILARELDIRVLETVCISSYDRDDRPGEAQLLKSIDAGDDGGRGILVVDDLVDTGNTAALVRQLLPAATLATVYAKPAAISLVDYHVRQFSQDTWIHFPWDVALRYAEPIVANRPARVGGPDGER